MIYTNAIHDNSFEIDISLFNSNIHHAWKIDNAHYWLFENFFTRSWVRAIQLEKLVMPIDLLFAFGYMMSVTDSNDIRSKLNGMFLGSLLVIYKNWITQ